MFGVCYSVGLFTGAYFYEKDIISIPELFGSYFGFMMGGMGLGQLGSIASDLKNGEIGANKFFQVIERIPNIKLKENKKPIILNDNNKLNGSIELKNITFAYPSAPQIKVLSNINISVEAGKTLALVGPSGSGYV